jgi:hypothetical protein
MKGYVPVVADITNHARVDETVGALWLQRKIEKAVDAVSGSAGIDSSRMGRFRSRVAHPLVSEGYHRAIDADPGYVSGPATP